MMVRKDLTSAERSKVMCMITMDAHSRDIIQKLIEEEVRQQDEF
jgi:dynein heavy chain